MFLPKKKKGAKEKNPTQNKPNHKNVQKHIFSWISLDSYQYLPSPFWSLWHRLACALYFVVVPNSSSQGGQNWAQCAWSWHLAYASWAFLFLLCRSTALWVFSFQTLHLLIARDFGSCVSAGINPFAGNSSLWTTKKCSHTSQYLEWVISWAHMVS